MRFVIAVSLFLTSLRDKVVKFVVFLALRASQNFFAFIAYLPLMLLLSFFLGAYSLPLGIFNAFITTLISVKRSIDDIVDNQEENYVNRAS